jgi:uncharacterized protein YecT (DUF1311 family)
MKIAAAIFFAVSILTTAVSSKAEDELQRCLDRPDGQTTYGMKACNAAEADRLDAALKDNYQSLLSHEKNNRDQLVAAQDAWGKSSISTCTYAYSLGQNGTISGVMSTGCLVDQTRRRVYELSRPGIQELSDKDPAACSGKSTGDDALVNCIAGEFARVDRYLNFSYRNILATATKDDVSIGKDSAGERPSLIRAEKAWIAFRDAQCGYLLARQQGAKARLVDLRCRTAMTVQRTKELEELQ